MKRIPPFPISLLAWPIYLETEEEDFELAATYDETGLLRRAVLKLGRVTTAAMFMAVGCPIGWDAGYRGEIGRDSEALLERIKRNGVEVWFRTGPLVGEELERF